MKLLQTDHLDQLRQKTLPVQVFDQRLRLIIAAMKKILVTAHGVGLAANQVGINLSIFIARPKNKFYVFINPIIEASGEPILVEEGCLSLPGKWGYLKRHPEIKITYQDLQGKKRILKTKGLLAQIIQHEVDHLNGGLFIDKAKEIIELPAEKSR